MVDVTVVTIFGVVLLLLVLARGLSKILRALEGVRQSLAKIAMGVRAIESETKPVGPGVGQLNGTLTDVAGGLESVKGSFITVDEKLGGVAKALGIGGA